MPGPDQLQPETQRVRGGVPARAAALAAGLALAGVIWLGLSGRAELGDAPPSPLALASSSAGEDIEPVSPAPIPPATEPRSEASPARSDPSPTSRPPATPLDPAALPLGDDHFGATLVIDGHVHFLLLHESPRGRFSAQHRLSYPRPAVPAELELVQLWTSDERPNFVRIAAYELVLPAFERGRNEAVVVLDEGRRARRRQTEAPRLVREGYSITLRAENRGDRAILLIELTSGRAEAARTPTVPLIRLLRPPDRPRVVSPIGHSWVAGY